MKMKTRDIRDYGTELLKDLFFPARCPICSELIRFEKRAGYHHAEALNLNEESKERKYSGLICKECVDKFAYIKEPYCRKCGKQLIQIHTGKDESSIERTDGRQEKICGDCASLEREFVQCRCLMVYDETAREIMTEVKYNSKIEYLESFALLAADRLGEWIREADPDCLIPVPVHRSRLKSRGYNQAEVLALELGKLLDIPVRTDILLRRKKTDAQKSLDPKRRMKNLQDAFWVTEDLPESMKVMVIDDIYTAGATLEACTENLMAAGCGKVFAMCVCAAEDVI